MANVQLEDIKYMGGDIVDGLISENLNKYESKGYDFQVIDLTKDPLPEVDLIFCRDCLVHLDYDNIQKVISNLKKSNITYLLTTSFYNHKINYNIVTGDWRPLNLQIAPFFWPEQQDIIIENCTEGNGTYADKSLMLWKVQDIPDLKLPSTKRSE